MLDYMASQRFKPAVEIAAADLDAWILTRYTAPASGITPEKSPDIVDPGQVKKGGGE
jgi:hypothetical protein